MSLKRVRLEMISFWLCLILAVMVFPSFGSRSCGPKFKQHDLGSGLVCLNQMKLPSSEITHAQASRECSSTGTDKNKGYLATPMTTEQQALITGAMEGEGAKKKHGLD